MIAAPLVPHAVAMLQAGDRLGEVLAVVVQDLKAVPRDPAAGMETKAVQSRPGVNRGTETFADVGRAGTGHSEEDRGIHQGRPVVSNAAMVSVDSTNGVLRTAVMATVVPMSAVPMTGASVIAAAVTPVPSRVASMTGVFRNVVPEAAGSVMAMHAACVPPGRSIKIARWMSSHAGKRVLMASMPWLMIFSGADMPPRRLSRQGARFTASGAPVR